MKVAVIDVGFNSLKMVKYRVEAEGSTKAYGQLGIMARLGEGLEQTGSLGNEPIARTIEALRLCHEMTDLEAIKHVLLIGTSPVREAVNRDEFMKRVHEETGMQMRVLTGHEEALYSFLGMARSVPAPTALFFDLGGGSLELTNALNHRVRRIMSLPLGALKLTSQFAGKKGTFSRKDRGRMSKLITQLLPSRRDLVLEKGTVLIGTGGTVRAMARFDQENSEYPFNKVHNYPISFDSAQQMSREFLRLEIDELDKIDAIGTGRSETIAAGSLVVRLLMKKLGLDTLIVSTHGVRDGILAEFVERGARQAVGFAQKEEIERILDRSQLLTRFSGSGSSELIQCLTRNHLVDERQKSILLTAVVEGSARDCAEALPDALFGILMSIDLPMYHEDQLFMAVSLVRARKSRTANWLLTKYGALLSNDDKKSVRKMGACLRLMEILSKSSAQFRVAYSGGLRITIIESEKPFPLGLARASALALSTSIKKPVTIFVSAKERERHAGLVRNGVRIGKK
jgi:exopolyphosphatase/guanosine-5'-triphosphate,3'-diphosphate pyrophosphatase